MRDLRGLLQLIDKIPRQQFLDAVDRMIPTPPYGFYRSSEG